MARFNRERTMSDRMIDISSPARLSIHTAALVIQRQDVEETIVPLEEIAAVIVSHGCVVFTHAVLSELARIGAVFIVCDEKHLPAGMLLPLQTHHAQREVFALQAAMPLPTRKRLWKQIIQAKVNAQGSLLKSVAGSARGFGVLEKQVRTGDPTNIEARAAKQYWRLLFGKTFRRNGDEAVINSHLNYGYAILRGIVARSICAAGLHPSLSLHHHNRYDSFALADDLMEPFRPIVDSAVWALQRKGGIDGELTQDGKRLLLSVLTRVRDYRRNESRTLFDIASRVSASLVRVIRGEAAKLQLPDIWDYGAHSS